MIHAEKIAENSSLLQMIYAPIVNDSFAYYRKLFEREPLMIDKLVATLEPLPLCKWLDHPDYQQMVNIIQDFMTKKCWFTFASIILLSSYFHVFFHFALVL